MLPSTGYFKGINCPFYDSGLCERPYCHFRHVKKDSLMNTSNESGLILQKLVSAAVQKVLQQTETSGPLTTQTNSEASASDSKTTSIGFQSKATYNPTPISQLNKINSLTVENTDDGTEHRKRHIPVPYTPRKPASLPIKRPEINGSPKPFIYIPPPIKYTPGCTETVGPDPYTPKGSVESTETYSPGIEKELPEYKPKETQSSKKRNYVPSEKHVNKKKILEYKPAKVSSSNEIPAVTYQPTPRSLAPCFSSDEDEPDVKKTKLSNDLNGLDDLGPEFDILGQILDEESSTSTQSPRPDLSIKNQKHLKPECSNSENYKVIDHKKVAHKDTKDKKSDEHHRAHISTSDKKENHKSHNKSKSDKSKEKSSKEKQSHNKEKEKSDGNIKHSSKKSHKHSTGDNKAKKEKKEHTTDKDRSSSRTTKSSKRSNDHDLKSEKSAKHSSSSKHKHKSKDLSKCSREDKKHKDKDKDPVVSDNDSDVIFNDEFEHGNEEVYDISSESDEEAIALECKRIFEEYVPTENKVTEKPSNIPCDDNNESEYVSAKKRISRTTDKIKVVSKPPVKPDYKKCAAQMMSERLSKVREYHASKNILSSTANNTAPKSDILKSNFTPTNTGGSKIRIAHVPYASTLLNAKKGIMPNLQKQEPSTSTTLAQTIKKGAQRVAHIPNEKFIDRPSVLEPLASKIPASIRTTYLNMMIDECLKIYLSAHDAYARAQHEELATSKKCYTVQIYKNSAVLTVSRLRKELQECNGVKKAGTECTTLQKLPSTITGETSQAGSWSIENKNRRIANNSHEFIGAKLYNNIKKWVLDEEQLQQNGFPRRHVSGKKGRATIYSQNKQTPPKGNIRNCCRCKNNYTVDKHGFSIVKQECIYHPNNKYKVRGEARYQCCSQDGSSDGCCVAPTHVFDYVDYENLKGFVTTLPPERDMDDYGVYSLDCEMCYTTHGLDLTRVTVINAACEVVYETFIKPLHPIIDYNTRYSGITEEHMANVKTTLLEVQATLLAMFNSKTILIGHSLESDFKALKLIHDSVIDTSILFPHKMGPPYKRALRNLSSDYLKKIIQNSVDGHDSAEDARTCMELIIYKLKEDLKTR